MVVVVAVVVIKIVEMSGGGLYFSCVQAGHSPEFFCDAKIKIS